MRRCRLVACAAALAGAAMAAAAAGPACRLDAASGLMWAAKTHDGGLHDGRRVWRAPDDVALAAEPPCSLGAHGSPTRPRGTLATERLAACDVAAYVAAANRAALCGHADWRVPRVAETVALTRWTQDLDDLSHRQVLGSLSPGWYWTATPLSTARPEQGHALVLLPPGASPLRYQGRYGVVLVRSTGGLR